MGSLMMHLFLVAALVVSMCAAPPDSFVVSVNTPVMVRRGHTTILPCWISPTQSAEGLEVRWYRSDHFDSPIMLYRERKMSQEGSYTGRISFGLHDAASRGLESGDVSLKLENVTLEDTGEYTCYVSSDQGYDRGSVSLTVTEIGEPVLLSTEWKDDNSVNVSCESGGWFPEPQVRWSDEKQALEPRGLKHSKDSSGLLSVHSWLLVSGSSEVSCSVSLSDRKGGIAKEARVRLEKPPQLDKPESGSSPAGWVAFALLLIATVVGIGVLWYKMRVKKAQQEGGSKEETQKLLSQEATQTTDLSTAKKHYVNVTLDKVVNPYLRIKDSIVRDANIAFPDGENVTCLTAIKGTPGFSSGQHYWEVSVGKPGIDIKKSWWVGVTGAASFSPEPVTPTTADCFWFLSSSPDPAESFQFSTEPKVSLPVNSRPQTVGVYLNYDGGRLSFYNVEKESLIGSLTVTFTGEVFPFFNPGKGDKASMEVLQRKEDNQPGDMGISEGPGTV